MPSPSEHFDCSQQLFPGIRILPRKQKKARLRFRAGEILGTRMGRGDGVIILPIRPHVQLRYVPLHSFHAGTLPHPVESRYLCNTRG
jgi:hypothetical protein